MSISQIKVIYTIKVKYVGNQTLDPIGGDIIANKIILPVREFRTFVLMNSPLGKFTYTNGGILYEYLKETLDRNAHICHRIMVFCVLHHVDYT